MRKQSYQVASSALKTSAGSTPPIPAAERSPGPGDDLGAWKAFLRSHAFLTRVLDEELQEREGLSLGDYDVLIQLAHAEGDRVPMCDLAEAVVLSRSGLTRRMDRLERSGLVRRTRGEVDARNVEASLTKAGRTRLRRARATHLGSVHERFQSCFSESELRTLAEMLERLLAQGDR